MPIKGKWERVGDGSSYEQQTCDFADWVQTSYSSLWLTRFSLKRVEWQKD
jgi:hypothetical protein